MKGKVYCYPSLKTVKRLFKKLTGMQETLEYKINKPGESFLFQPTIQIDGSWIFGLISLEVYNFFSITKKENEFEIQIILKIFQLKR